MMNIAILLSLSLLNKSFITVIGDIRSSTSPLPNVFIYPLEGISIPNCSDIFLVVDFVFNHVKNMNIRYSTKKKSSPPPEKDPLRKIDRIKKIKPPNANRLKSAKNTFMVKTSLSV